MAIYHGAGGAGDSTNDAVVTEVAGYAAQAASSATNAATSATNSSTSASSASSSASAAASSATSAANSVSSAQSAATLAQSYANASDASSDDAAADAALAATYRQQAQNAAVAAASSADQAELLVTDLAADLASIEANKVAAEAAEAQAAIYATNAGNSATTASTQAANASTSASSASASATSASTSATNAAASATTATSASNTAVTKASEASTSATNAASSATAAASSASSASTSATAASSSASSASSSASAASTSASNAASSASSASTSASNAATSATNASNSASSAASAQTAAEAARDSTLASLDSFDDRYLGAKSSDPSLDNDGNAILAGAIYFNTTSNIMKVYTGSLWVAAYVSGTDFLAKANNLSDLPSAATARTNLGLGTAATTAATDYAASTNPTINGNVTTTGLNFDSNTFVIDATNNRVGVGTASPLASLSIGAGSLSDANVPLQLNAASGAQTFLGVNRGGGYGLLVGYDYISDIARIRNIANTAMTFETNNTERMRLDSSGNLGLGVTPSAWRSNTPSIQVGSTGATLFADSGVAAGLGNNFYLNSSSQYIYQRTDAASRYQQYQGIHSWYNAPSGTAGNAITFTQAMTLDASGNLGVGTTSPDASYRVDIKATTAGARIQSTTGTNIAFLTLNNTGSDMYVGREGSAGGVLATGTSAYSGVVTVNGAYPLAFGTNSSERMRISAAGGLSVGTTADPGAGAIYATGNITAYYSSDRTLKENIQDVDNALDKVCAIGSKTFDWTDEYIAAHGGEDGYFVQKSDFGVVAQDVQAVFPQAVRTRQDGTLAVDYEKLATLAFGAIKELVKRVEALEAK